MYNTFCLLHFDSSVISPRRFGKSGLVIHALEAIEGENSGIDTLYTDIYATESLCDFIDNLSSAVLAKFPEKTPLGRRFWGFIKSIRPYLTFDQLTGFPQVHLEFASQLQKRLH